VENLEACLLIFQASKSDRLQITEEMLQLYPTIWSSKAPERKEQEESKLESEPGNFAFRRDSAMEIESEGPKEKQDPMIVVSEEVIQSDRTKLETEGVNENVFERAENHFSAEEKP
ncbi:MAG TPA: hypothetical protein PLS50_08625, partial [Candidatus Dojkabacteria bacterium]|nr:hypothetical protein [Candidatus Dojkabacteria bacterium]